MLRKDLRILLRSPLLLGLLAGAEIYGLPGVLVALPLLAAARAIWEFFAERIHFATWDGEEPLVPVEVVEVEAAPEAPARAATP